MSAQFAAKLVIPSFSLRSSPSFSAPPLSSLLSPKFPSFESNRLCFFFTSSQTTSFLFKMAGFHPRPVRTWNELFDMTTEEIVEESIRRAEIDQMDSDHYYVKVNL